MNLPVQLSNRDYTWGGGATLSEGFPSVETISRQESGAKGAYSPRKVTHRIRAADLKGQRGNI